MKYILIVLLVPVLTITKCQDIRNTSFVTSTGEKILRLEITIPISRSEAWSLFTQDDQLQRWMAPLAHIELRQGGYIVTNYNKNKSLSDSTSIRLGIINYLEPEILTLKVKLNKAFPKSTRDTDGNLQEIIQIIPAGKRKTRIVSSMLGWGDGEDWNKVYDFFLKGNTWTFGEMLKLYKK